MKTVAMEQATLDACVHVAQSERVVITRDGNPVALIVGLEGFDSEQVQLGASDKFWKAIAQRRQEQVLNRSELEQKIKRRKSPERET
jgi:antitoxin (DNA-binding transcriptional repressor) of toxin-antitoxin stability system